jgi:hypothetical protein
MSVPLTWIVENFSNDQGVVVLTQHIKDKGYNLIELSRTSGYEKSLVKLDNQCVLFYGSINMAEIIRKHLTTCAPVVWSDPSDFLCSNYYSRFTKFLFNDRHKFMTLGEFRDNLWNVYFEFGKDAMIFIRPDSGDKTFAGQLLDLQDVSVWDNAIKCNAKPDDIIVVSTPKNIIGEWRYIVSQTEILGMSCYRYHGKSTLVPSAPPLATELVKKIIDSAPLPAKICAVDIASDSDNNYWLLEFNSFNSCGLYAMDKSKIVKVASEIALSEYEETK